MSATCCLAVTHDICNNDHKWSGHAGCMMTGPLWSGHADCMMHDYKLSGLPSCMMHDHICMVWSCRLHGLCRMPFYWPCPAQLLDFHTVKATKPQATIAWKPMDELLCYVYTVGRKKSARRKKLLPGGFLMNFSPIFLHKTLTVSFCYS